MKKFAIAAAAALCSAVFSTTAPALADTVTHFGDGVGNNSIPNLLDQVGIGSSNIGSETTAHTFFVPGEAGTMTDLTFSFMQDTGGFQFEFGYIAMNDTLRQTDPVSDKLWWWLLALQYSSPVSVFNDRIHDPGAVSATYSLEAGTELLFFLLPNSTISDLGALVDEALANAFDPNASLDDTLRSPLFSLSDANEGEVDQMLSFIDNGVTLFTFEDLIRTRSDSDEDFTDLAFLIDVELGVPDGTRLSGPPTTTTPPITETPQDVPEPPVVLSLLGLGVGAGLMLKRKQH